MPSVVVTSAGLAALLNAEQNGTLPVKITKFGLGTGNYTPTADKTALQSKFKEITALSGGAVGDNVIHVTMTDASSDAYTANEVGVYLEDGTLFALSSQPVGAILQKAAGSQALLSLDLVLQGGTGGVTVSGGTNFFNPPSTTTTAGVVKLASLDEITAGTNTTKACTPMGVWNFVKNYVASAIDSLKTLLRAEIAAACLAAVPIGTMLPYAGGEVPEGFLLCNGASLSRTEYPELFAAIGDRWGSDSASTFKLPDTHHRVFEGTTVLSEVGQYIEAGLPNIEGALTWIQATNTQATQNGALFWRTNSNVQSQSKTLTTSDNKADIGFSAQRHNPIYDSSNTTVKVDSLCGLALIRAYQ
jgi:microcystin-dependent protein